MDKDRCLRWLALVILALVSLPCACAQEKKSREGSFNGADWPMYNHDVLGHRHNACETVLNSKNVKNLVEKWRFPRRQSDATLGVVHATPVVVDGYVYFGTATDAAFYCLTPQGKCLWSYRNSERELGLIVELGANIKNTKLRALSQTGGILASALVVNDLVYFGDTMGCFVALDRMTGKEVWKVDARHAPFPGHHWFNVFLASPIFADNKIIVGGGTLEQIIAGTEKYPGSTGRGFVVAFDPKTGAVQWKFDVGPKPEKLDPPVTITDIRRSYTWTDGPATSSVWSTPSYDSELGQIYFGTDVNTAPRQPTADDPRFETKDSCAVFAVTVKEGKKVWSTQLNRGDVWTNSMHAYDRETGLYKDQSIGDTPKIYDLVVGKNKRRVVGVGSKNGGFYVLDARDGDVVANTPVYRGKPDFRLTPRPNKRTLALPSAIGGIQTGCAFDGHRVFVNGTDAIMLGHLLEKEKHCAPTAGRVTAISPNTKQEYWRHERPKVARVGGPAPRPVWHNIGDPMLSGLAVANGVLYGTTATSGKLICLDKMTGELLKEIDLGPVFCGPSVSRGRIYVGTGNTLFSGNQSDGYFPKKWTGHLICFGLPESTPTTTGKKQPRE